MQFPSPLRLLCTLHAFLTSAWSTFFFFFGDETKTEQTVTIKSALSAILHLHKNFHSDLCVCLKLRPGWFPRHLLPCVKWTISSYVSNNQQGLSVLGFNLSFPKILSKRLGAKGKTCKMVLRKCSCRTVKLKLTEAEDVGNHWSFSAICINLNLYSLNSLSFPGKCRAARRIAKAEITFWKRRKALTEDVSFCVPCPGSAPQGPRSHWAAHQKRERGGGEKEGWTGGGAQPQLLRCMIFLHPILRTVEKSQEKLHEAGLIPLSHPHFSPITVLAAGQTAAPAWPQALLSNPSPWEQDSLEAGKEEGYG